MELIRGPATGRSAQCVVTIGSFDGLHLGHQALIERLRWHGRRLGLPTMMLSFEPLPREFLQSSDPPARLTNFRERWRLLEGFGLDRLWLLRFDEALRLSSGSEFMGRLAAARPRVVVVGHDFHFGRGGEASAQWCAARASAFGFEVDVVEAVGIEGERVSSGRVRRALQAGDFAGAARLLGRRYSMRGRVQRGNRLGRTLGFPTANIAVKRRRVPLQGVFAVRVRGVDRPAGAGAGPGGSQSEGLPGVANLGTRPMVGGAHMLLEAHLFDFQGDLYGRELEVQFFARLRDEMKFDSMAAMVAQMHRDAQQARAALAGDMTP
ncbi:MAG TPA: bifunctional riboflavin kinase/FAD synthetase [Steroidobacteraceae bacterium]|nr:bifunctional riboflavin kinase/FAD synthetase [Steroidobacteraceae bacterium]